ncbi:SdrD B-like domain-containing protein [Cellulomonas endometrii]|uniref:SdrD B-like domain-containing protein n=1 Tax=Cellulomonas endometrii TaxID=3036301 RepID=UPI0024AE213B|nr:SdrD B-like domain-containing protein [Cellulomonas endometrii]
MTASSAGIAAADPTSAPLVIESFEASGGAALTNPQPEADPAYAQDRAYTAATPTGTVDLTASYRCASDTLDCPDAVAQFVLDDLRLASGVVVGGLDVSPVITYYSDAAASTVTTDWANAAAFSVAFQSVLDGGGVGLGAGITGTLESHVVVVQPTGGGPQSGSAVVTTTPSTPGVEPARVQVSTEFPVSLATTTSLVWAKAGYLSGVDDGTDSPTNTATITSTLSGDPADTLTVSWPASPSAVPVAGTVGMLNDLTAAAISAWPVGAAQVKVTGWRWSGAGTPVAVDLGTVAAPTGGATSTGDLLAAVDTATRSQLTGLRLVYTAASGATIMTGATSVVTLEIREHGSSQSTPVPRTGTVDYVTDAPAAAFDASSDLNTLTVTGAASTSAVRGTQTSATSSDSRSFRVYDPRAYAGSATTLQALNGGTVYGGGYVLATASGTNWSRRAVQDLNVRVRPDQPAVDTTNALLNPDLPAIDSRVFGPGLEFAGFGATRTASGTGASADGSGALLGGGIAGTGATVTLTVVADGTARSVDLDSSTQQPTLPTDPAVFGLSSWSQVSGFSVLVHSDDAVVPMGGSVTIPYLLHAATVAAAQTYADHTVASTRLGADTSAVVPRTARSGNRPVTAATVAVAVPTVAVDGAKELVEPYVTTAAGSTSTAVLSVTSRAGASMHLPDTLTVEDSARATAGATNGSAWWNALAPTTISAPSGVTTTVEFYTNTTGAPSWQPYTGDLTALNGADTWRGFRLSFKNSDSSTFPDGTTLRARVTFAVRAGATWTDGATLRNVATVTSAATVEGNLVTSTPVNVSDTTVGFATGVGPGTAALLKQLSNRSGIEGTAAASVATLSWGTRGQQFGSMTVTDANALTDSNDTPGVSRTNSFWDTFDLVRIRAITSDATRETSKAYDPYLIFDQVTDVQVFDVVDGQWHSLATHEFTSGAWSTRSGNRSDVTFGGTNSAGAFPYVGSFPGASIGTSLRPRVGGVRLVYAALDETARAAAAATVAGDWRAALPAVPPGAVAPSDTLVREVQLEVALRDTSRTTSAPVNDAFQYTTNEAGRTVNSARVTGWSGTDATGARTDLGGPVNGAGWATFRVTPASLGAQVTKTWQREANGEPLTGSELSELALPVNPDAPDAEWPTATVNIAAHSTSSTRVDSLTLTEPAGITAGAQLDADDPFARFAITDITIADLSAAGSTATNVVLFRWNGSQITADPAVGRATAEAYTAAQLTDVVGVQVRYTGRISTSGTATLTLATQLLAANRVDGSTPQDLVAGDGLQVDDTARVTVEDARVCAGETGDPTVPLDSCTGTAPVDRDSSVASVTVHAPDVEAFPALEVNPADVQRDATDPTVTATLSAQNFGLSDADELLVTDADPRFFNAVQARTITLQRLPSGAEEAVLEVLLADEDLDIGASGAYTGTQTWQTWATRNTVGATWDIAALAASHGASAEQVIGVRVRFRNVVGGRITAPGQGFGEVTFVGRVREELRTGGLPSAVGAAGWSYDGAEELDANPGETARGVISNVVTAAAIRDGISPGENSTQDVTFTVHAGAATLRVQKAEVAAQSRVPGDYVQYRMTVSNTASASTAADVTGLVLTDVLPEDGSLLYGTAPAGQDPWTVQAADGSASPIGAPTVTASSGLVRFTWGDDTRLAAGQQVVVLIWLRVAPDLSTTSVVNVARVTSTSRPPVPAPTGTDGGTACQTGTYDSTSGECRVAATGLTIGGANVYVSQKWVRAAGASSAVRTTGGSTACTPRGTGASDVAWYRYPCAVLTEAGGTTNWQVQVTSRATVATDRVELIDMLSQAGDYAAMDASGAPRGSQWRPVWDGVVPTFSGTVPAGASVEVYTTTADYRSGALPANGAFDPVPGTWSSTPLSPGDTVPAVQAAKVTGLKFVVKFATTDLFSSGETVRLQWSMTTPLSGVTDGADAWNSFAFRVPANATAGRPVDVTSVPLKAGARFHLPDVADPLVAVGDRVWVDANRNGVQDSGEDGVGGAYVDVFAGSGAAATWVASTVTDADGYYLVDGLPAGTYQLRFTFPGGVANATTLTTTDTGADGVDSDATTDATGVLIADVALTAAASATSVSVDDMPTDWLTAHPDLTAAYVDTTRDVGVQWRWLSVGDTVWFDANRDGRQDPGEARAEDVTVELISAATDAVLSTTTTDAVGAYRFDRLEPGTYIVRVSLPDDLSGRWTFTTTGVGDSLGDSDTVVPATNGVARTAPFTLTPGAGGRMLPVGDLSGQIWSDVDAAFADPSLDAGLAERPVSVGDRVWVDVDGDGIQDVDEPGLAGVTVNLTASGAPVTDVAGNAVQPVITGADGAYSFNGLLPGAYTVSVDPAASGPALAGYIPAPAGATGDPATDSSDGSTNSRVLVGGESDTTLDFGYEPLRAIGDTVWRDDDRDGVQDVGEPGVPDAIVRLLDATGTNVLATTVTDAAGGYRFDLLHPGGYRVQVELAAVDAARYTFTKVGAASRADADSDVIVDAGGAGGTATSAEITIGASQSGERASVTADAVTAPLIDPTWDAGIVERPVSVGHVVWYDVDRDGIQDTTESGIAGVVLSLTAPDGHTVEDVDGNPVGQETTDTAGRYAFTNLLPGQYVVAIDRIASATALRGFAPTLDSAGNDDSVDSSTWTATSRALVGGDVDATLDFGLVLADDVQLALRKTAVARDASTITWEVTVASTGTQDAYAGFAVVDALPGALSFKSASGAGFSCNAEDQVVRCDHDEALAAGESATVQIVTGVAAAGSDVTNTAMVDVEGRGYRFEVLSSSSKAWSDAPEAVTPVDDPLARTGSSVGVPIGIAALLLILGASLVVVVRPRPQR